ncbi:MAG TPA: hypothetical protein V6D09_05025 [Leptolyngbyaceae cyanobacterium]
MNTPLEEYRKSTYDKTVERIKQQQSARKTWLDVNIKPKPQN